MELKSVNYHRDCLFQLDHDILALDGTRSLYYIKGPFISVQLCMDDPTEEAFKRDVRSLLIKHLRMIADSRIFITGCRTLVWLIGELDWRVWSEFRLTFSLHDATEMEMNAVKSGFQEIMVKYYGYPGYPGYKWPAPYYSVEYEDPLYWIARKKFQQQRTGLEIPLEEILRIEREKAAQNAQQSPLQSDVS